MLEPTFTYRAAVQGVVDADTVDMLVDLGFRTCVTIRTRLLGINAPEMRTEEGKVAKAALLAFMPVGSAIVVRTYKDPTDKYGRWIALIEHAGVDVSSWLVANNHAVSKDYS